jgi:ubiquitin carboxyl-terminal hydrolase 34
MLAELKRMFAYMLASERRAFDPSAFCAAYDPANGGLNVSEQKDMQEFFTDLIAKLEESCVPVKPLFGGVVANLVVSLDCPHVSRTLDEFYTVRCQVAGMRHLADSLDELTVKDTLDGDNMYTCSTCGKRVRAEKRACFRRLPRILCFNTMRYTFNMATMRREKVNTHFAFPLELDMTPYMEHTLLATPPPPPSTNTADDRDDQSALSSAANDRHDNDESYSYDLIGVTVHTGTADTGHYYSFIKVSCLLLFFLCQKSDLKSNQTVGKETVL